MQCDKVPHEGQYMNATIKQIQRGILVNKKGRYMKDSNTLADNVTIKQLQRKMLLNTRGQYMKELNTLARNATNNFL